MFSAEDGTAAASLPGRIPYRTALSRYNMVLEVQDRVEESISAALMGRELEVVVDAESNSETCHLVGRSYREAPEVDGAIYLRQSGMERGPVRPGDFCLAKVVGREGLDLVGEI